LLSFIPEGSNKVLISSPESFETFVTDEKNWCIEMKTMVTPNTKLMVRVWPNNAADARPVNIVATVDEYFFNIVSAQQAHQLIRLLVGTVLTTKKLLLTVQEVGKYKMPKSSC
jgi:hypothetical protein